MGSPVGSVFLREQKRLAGHVRDCRLFGFTTFVFGPDGNLYAGEFNSEDGRFDGRYSILRFDGTTGVFIGTFASVTGGALISATGLVFGPDGNLYVSGINSDDVVRFDGTTGALIDIFVPAGSGGLDAPDALTFGPDGNLYVASLGTNSVLRYDRTTGAFIDTFIHPGSGGLSVPKGLLFRAAAPAVNKVALCHKTHSTSHPWVRIVVSKNAVAAHLRHGDQLAGPGGCSSL